MSYVYILTQTDYKHHEDFENEENKDLAVLYVYTSAKTANEAAKEWVEEYFSDGENEVKRDGDGCDTWTCSLYERDDQSHVLISVVKKELMGEPEEESAEEEEEGESDDEEHTEHPAASREAQEPPTKRTRME